MTGTAVLRGNILRSNLYSLTLSPAAVAANTAVEQTFPFASLNVTDFVILSYQTAGQAGLEVGNARVSAPNTLAITFSNGTGASITPTANGIYCLLHMVSEYLPLQTII